MIDHRSAVKLTDSKTILGSMWVQYGGYTMAPFKLLALDHFFGLRRNMDSSSHSIWTEGSGLPWGGRSETKGHTPSSGYIRHILYDKQEPAGILALP